MFIPEASGSPTTLSAKHSSRNSEQLPRRDLSEFQDQTPAASTPAVVVSSPSEQNISAPEQPEQERPVSPPVQTQSIKQKRFSMLKFRNASDSQLALKARSQAGAVGAAADAPPVPKSESCFLLFT